MSGSQSTDAVVEELINFCRSESLSLDGLREIIERGCAPNNDENYEFFLEACRNEFVTEGILRFLLEYFPNAANTVTAGGNVPLHMICFNKNATRGMVQLLVDACPESIDSANNDGQMPLHILCDNKDIADSTAGDILGVFLERCPDAAEHAEGEDGFLPIHIAIFAPKSLEFCRMLIDAYPGSERIAVIGRFPLHIACRHGSVAVAKYLLKLYPECTSLGDTDGAYPIHEAVARVKSEAPTSAFEMVQMQLDCDLNLASQKFSGIFPLSLACLTSMFFRGDDAIVTSKVNAALKIAHVLYDAYPGAIESNHVTSNVTSFHREIKAFINAQLTYARQARNSSLMSTRDENGQLPLHRALCDNVTLGSIKLIVKGNRDAVQTPDNSGALPLHLAIQHHDSTKVVDYLIGLDPKTLTAVDREGNTALHLACRGAKYDTIALLLEKYGAVSVSQSNVLNELPIHLLFESNAVVIREDETKYLESVFQLLRANPETVMVSEDAKQGSISQGGRPSRTGKKRKYYA